MCRCFSCEFFQWTDAGKPSNSDRCSALPEGAAPALNSDADAWLSQQVQAASRRDRGLGQASRTPPAALQLQVLTALAAATSQTPGLGTATALAHVVATATLVAMEHTALRALVTATTMPQPAAQKLVWIRLLMKLRWSSSSSSRQRGPSAAAVW